VIEFHLDSRSGVAPYLQLIHQVRQALRLGLLRKGDQLPKVKDVAAGLAINPNTVLKAYQPVSHYWPLQLVETGIFLVLAVALAWFCFWRLGRRLS
jgi:hypothetical protein